MIAQGGGGGGGGGGGTISGSGVAGGGGGGGGASGIRIHRTISVQSGQRVRIRIGEGGICGEGGESGVGGNGTNGEPTIVRIGDIIIEAQSGTGGDGGTTGNPSNSQGGMEGLAAMDKMVAVGVVGVRVRVLLVSGVRVVRVKKTTEKMVKMQHRMILEVEVMVVVRMQETAGPQIYLALPEQGVAVVVVDRMAAMEEFKMGIRAVPMPLV